MLLTTRLYSLAQIAVDVAGLRSFSRSSSIKPVYVQGQYNEKNPKIREYFYYIDHNGMLFLDDARMKNFTSCFKEVKFLTFFIRQIKENKSENYRESFPYISMCGTERNYVRCDDLPIVFTHLIEKEGLDVLSYGGTGDKLTYPFQPERLYMDSQTGRVYHPIEKKPLGVGLIRSKLAIELSSRFVFEDTAQLSPKAFMWKNEKIILKNEDIAEKLANRIRHPLYITEDEQSSMPTD